nr:PREDICTED: alpha-1,6-mannosyl-glycoprotein 2-beta-N-acetylglucosaminyltransferase-like isoform X1 [Bemisia tabaci]
MRVKCRHIRILVIYRLSRCHLSTCFRPLLLPSVCVLFFLLHLYFLHTATLKSDDEAYLTGNDAVQYPTSVFNMISPKLQNYLIGTLSDIRTNSIPKVLMTSYDIQESIKKYNELQIVENQNVFGPLHNDSLVLVIQVHNRIQYLRHLITSLAKAKDIESALLIFSHDYYDAELNELVQTIRFCKFMQIFYPHSIQTHMNEFPGESPGDCPRNINKEQAIANGCTNALHPDLYGHYREAKITQIKHHWWWKANRVFNQLEITRHHTGLVLFLEEDHYVAEDFIHVLGIMEKTAGAECPQCSIYSLGPPPKAYKSYEISEEVEQTSHLSNMGMAFNSSVWRKIYNCSKSFCEFDDYNWDFSLQHVLNNCLRRSLVSLVLISPRAFHIGECGVHHTSDCTSTKAVSKVEEFLRLASKNFYPKHLTIKKTKKWRPSSIGNGGWGDIRDHELCLNMTIPQR